MVIFMFEVYIIPFLNKIIVIIQVFPLVLDVDFDWASKPMKMFWFTSFSCVYI